MGNIRVIWRPAVATVIVSLRWFCVAMAVAAIAYIVWFDGAHIREPWFSDCAGCVDVIRVPFEWDNIGYYRIQAYAVMIANVFVLYRLKGLGKWYDWSYIFTMLVGLAITVFAVHTIPAEGRHYCDDFIDDLFLETGIGVLLLYVLIVFPVNIISLLYVLFRKSYNRAVKGCCRDV